MTRRNKLGQRIVFVQIRDCPDCVKFLERHPTLWAQRIAEQGVSKGEWNHVTMWGKKLHKMVLNNQTK